MCYVNIPVAATHQPPLLAPHPPPESLSTIAGGVLSVLVTLAPLLALGALLGAAHARASGGSDNGAGQ